VNGEEEEGKEEREQELQLLYAIVTALGLAWPLNRDTQVDCLGSAALTSRKNVKRTRVYPLFPSLFPRRWHWRGGGG
jgi:hypothetical protein